MIPLVFVGTTEFIHELVQNGYALAVSIALMVMAVAAVMYELSYVIKMPGIRGWSLTQFYEAIVGLVFFAVFFGLYYLLSLNPTPMFTAFGALPPQCSGSSTLFDLAACDIGTFTSSAFGAFNVLYYSTLLTGLIPSTKISATIPPFALGIGFEGTASIFPSSAFSDMASTGMSILVFMLFLNELQLILTSASWLFFGLFLSIGLVAWVFGVSRGFGGAMIALALGLGFVYPLLVSLTYGFIDSQINAAPTAILVSTLSAVGSLTNGGLANAFGTFAFGNLVNFLASFIAGLTFIPFINFMILDAFIVDFSKAIGERISFMAMLSNVI